MNVGLMRVRNEARWIARCVGSIMPLCDRVFVMDDHSTDDTREICAALPKVTVLPSPFTGLNEARDKNWLLDQARPLNPDWCIAIDGDEMLAPGAESAVRAAMSPSATCLSLRVLYLWDGEDRVRVDGVYGDFHRESIFRPTEARYSVNEGGANFHCGNVPSANRRGRRVLKEPLLHFGYMHREDRERKFAWYNREDPNNMKNEDGYRHMVVGDIFPADSTFKYGGPLNVHSLDFVWRPQVCA